MQSRNLDSARTLGPSLSGDSEGKKKMITRKTPIHLYWVTTPDHGEDWFILARTPQAAAKFHDDYDGYDHSAAARLVVADTRSAECGITDVPRHAQIPELRKLGFEIVDLRRGQRIVRRGRELFVEGMLDLVIAELADNRLEAVGKGRPNQTKRSTPPN